MSHVLTSVRSLHSARSISPGSGRALLTATASRAEEATCACTPHSRRATATAPAPSAALTNCRLSRQARIWDHVTFTRQVLHPIADRFSP